METLTIHEMCCAASQIAYKAEADSMYRGDGVDVYAGGRQFLIRRPSPRARRIWNIYAFEGEILVIGEEKISAREALSKLRAFLGI